MEEAGGAPNHLDVGPMCWRDYADHRPGCFVEGIPLATSDGLLSPLVKCEVVQGVLLTADMLIG